MAHFCRSSLAAKQLQSNRDKPVVAHLKLSGFYELVPAGEPGNLEGIEPTPPAKS